VSGKIEDPGWVGQLGNEIPLHYTGRRGERTGWYEVRISGYPDGMGWTTDPPGSSREDHSDPDERSH
jgi:hypothetical protein